MFRIARLFPEPTVKEKKKPLTKESRDRYSSRQRRILLFSIKLKTKTLFNSMLLLLLFVIILTVFVGLCVGPFVIRWSSVLSKTLSNPLKKQMSIGYCPGHFHGRNKYELIA